MFTGRTPAITQAQIAAVVGWVAAQAVAWGWLDTSRSQTLVSGGSTILFAAWKLADAYLRGQRAQATLSSLPAPASPPPSPPAAAAPPA